MKNIEKIKDYLFDEEVEYHDLVSANGTRIKGHGYICSLSFDRILKRIDNFYSGNNCINCQSVRNGMTDWKANGTKECARKFKVIEYPDFHSCDDFVKGEIESGL